MAIKSSKRSLRALILLSCSLACQQASAQFSFPYDPDFANQETRPSPEETSAQPKSAQEAPPPEPSHPSEIPAWMRAAGPFLLFDRPEGGHFFEVAVETAPPRDLHEFIRAFESFTLDQRKWNNMRKDYEQGTLPLEEIETPPISTETQGAVAISTMGPKPPSPELELPTYGTSLSITGRKVIGVNFSDKRFLHDQVTTGRPKTTNLIDITQQLQLRMQGKVGPKITVNVDYDDTKTNKQDISVVYQGDPNEIVQNASFGDIDLSLPATEFVSYNKQLFGIRVNLKYKGFSAIFIGSRTKGQTKVKQFRGNTQFTGVDILDTAYVPRRYYDLTFGNPVRLPIRPGSEKVFISKAAGAAPNVIDVNLTVDDLTNRNSSFTGTFDQLAAGVDYTVDYTQGILTFKNSLDAQFTIAVDFTDSSAIPISQQTSVSTGTSGGTRNLKIIKTFADVPIISSTTEVGFKREMKTFYNIGRTQIVRDDGRGNFALRVLDQSRNEVGPSLNPVQKYPDTITVDFENGLFQLQQPFGISASSPQPDPDIYSPTPLTKHLFHLDLNFRLKTFALEPNLVLQSEVVLLDNIKLQRNVDYFIDYDSGFITFFNEQRIRPDSVIDISYEVAPFAGTASDSLLGTRLSYAFNPHWSLGSTLLFETGSKPPTVPNVGDLAKSLLIYEGDTQLKDIQLAPWLRIQSLQGEIAQSVTNPNLAGNALVDNMEGIRQEDVVVTQAINWQIASNPTQGPADPLALNWITEDVPVLQINPRAQANQTDSQKVLDLNYDFTVNSTTEVSIVYSFSPTGLDFTQKTVLEVTMFESSASLNDINFHLGGINEDADGTGGITLNCSDGSVRTHAPKTEDTDCDGILQPGEDIGWLYSPAGKNSVRYGAGNGRIDTEDLNGNGRLDSQDFTGDDYGYAGSNPGLFDVTAGSTITALNFTGWHTFQIPLNISSSTVANWTAIKQVRISMRKRPGGTSSGTIKFAKVSVVGNTWERGQAGDPATGQGQIAAESLTVNAVNNVANPNYVPIFSAGGDAQQVFHDLYGDTGQLQKQNNSSNLSEQAMELRFSGLTPGTTVFTRRVFPRSIDLSQHKHFNFLVYGNADPANAARGDKILFVRVGSDQTFFEMDIPINFIGWKKFTANQAGSSGNSVPNMWTLGQGTAGTVIFSTGTPNLQQIGTITVGIYSTGTLTTAGAVWVDEMYISDPFKLKGTAQKLNIELAAPGWATFGAGYRYIDHNYQTPTTAIFNQDNRVDSAHLELNRLAFLPLRFNVSRTIAVTQNTNATGNNSNLVTSLQQGKVVTWDGHAAAKFIYGSWPSLSMGYDRTRIGYDLLSRLDDRITYTNSLSLPTIPIHKPYLPTNVSLSYTYSKYAVSFESLAARLTPNNFNTDEFTNTYGGQLSFVPWKGSTLNPTYSLSTVKENRSDLTSGTEMLSSYPKSLDQTVGFASNFRILPWLNPTVSYSIHTIENNNLTVSSVTVNQSTTVFQVGDIKVINRQASGNITLNLSMGDIFPKSKLFKSLNFTNGYQLQDGDVTQNVEKGLNTRFALWVRTPLHPSNPAAQQTRQNLIDTFNSTQRWFPLEGYNLAGRKAAFRTLSITNNLSQSIQRNNATGTFSRTITTTLPDLITSLNQLEQILFLERWVKNMQIDLKYHEIDTLNVGASRNDDSSFGSNLRAMIKQRFDTTLSFNLRDTSQQDLLAGQLVQKTSHQDATLQTTFNIRRFVFTPKVDYAQDSTTLGTGIQTQNTTVITPSILFREDIALPRGLYIPFTKKTLTITNRVIWTTTLSLAWRSSPVTIADNSKLASLTTSADYEIAKNLRMTLNGALQRLWHKFLPEEDFISYQFGTTMTLQF